MKIFMIIQLLGWIPIIYGQIGCRCPDDYNMLDTANMTKCLSGGYQCNTYCNNYFKGMSLKLTQIKNPKGVYENLKSYEEFLVSQWNPPIYKDAFTYYREGNPIKDTYYWCSEFIDVIYNDFFVVSSLLPEDMNMEQLIESFKVASVNIVDRYTNFVSNMSAVEKDENLLKLIYDDSVRLERFMGKEIGFVNSQIKDIFNQVKCELISDNFTFTSVEGIALVSFSLPEVLRQNYSEPIEIELITAGCGNSIKMREDLDEEEFCYMEEIVDYPLGKTLFFRGSIIGQDGYNDPDIIISIPHVDANINSTSSLKLTAYDDHIDLEFDFFILRGDRIKYSDTIDIKYFDSLVMPIISITRNRTEDGILRYYYKIEQLLFDRNYDLCYDECITRKVLYEYQFPINTISTVNANFQVVTNTDDAIIFCANDYFPMDPKIFKEAFDRIDNETIMTNSMYYNAHHLDNQFWNVVLHHMNMLNIQILQRLFKLESRVVEDIMSNGELGMLVGNIISGMGSLQHRMLKLEANAIQDAIFDFSIKNSTMTIKEGFTGYPDVLNIFKDKKNSNCFTKSIYPGMSTLPISNKYTYNCKFWNKLVNPSTDFCSEDSLNTIFAKPEEVSVQQYDMTFTISAVIDASQNVQDSLSKNAKAVFIDSKGIRLNITMGERSCEDSESVLKENFVFEITGSTYGIDPPSFTQNGLYRFTGENNVVYDVVPDWSCTMDEMDHTFKCVATHEIDIRYCVDIAEPINKSVKTFDADIFCKEPNMPQNTYSYLDCKNYSSAMINYCTKTQSTSGTTMIYGFNHYYSLLESINTDMFCVFEGRNCKISTAKPQSNHQRVGHLWHYTIEEVENVKLRVVQRKNVIEQTSLTIQQIQDYWAMVKGMELNIEEVRALQYEDQRLSTVEKWTRPTILGGLGNIFQVVASIIPGGQALSTAFMITGGLLEGTDDITRQLDVQGGIEIATVSLLALINGRRYRKIKMKKDYTKEMMKNAYYDFSTEGAFNPSPRFKAIADKLKRAKNDFSEFKFTKKEQAYEKMPEVCYETFADNYVKINAKSIKVLRGPGKVLYSVYNKLANFKNENLNRFSKYLYENNMAPFHSQMEIQQTYNSPDLVGEKYFSNMQIGIGERFSNSKNGLELFNIPVIHNGIPSGPSVRMLHGVVTEENELNFLKGIDVETQENMRGYYLIDNGLIDKDTWAKIRNKEIMPSEILPDYDTELLWKMSVASFFRPSESKSKTQMNFDIMKYRAISESLLEQRQKGGYFYSPINNNCHKWAKEVYETLLGLPNNHKQKKLEFDIHYRNFRDTESITDTYWQLYNTYWENIIYGDFCYNFQ